MQHELEEAVKIYEAAGMSQESQDAERTRMENALNALCHLGVVYPDTHQIGSGGFSWICTNRAFVSAYFNARGDVLVIDDTFGMAYVKSGKPNSMRAGLVSFTGPEALVGAALRLIYETSYGAGEGSRIECTVEDIEDMFRQLVPGASNLPPTRLISSMLKDKFKSYGCVRYPSSSEGFVILPGVMALFSNDFIETMRQQMTAQSDQETVNA